MLPRPKTTEDRISSEEQTKFVFAQGSPGLEIHFFGGSKLLLPSSRPGSKTNFVVATLYVHFYGAVVLGCVDDPITNITEKCIKLIIP